MNTNSNLEIRSRTGGFRLLGMVAVAAILSLTAAAATRAGPVNQSEAVMIFAKNDAPDKMGKHPGPPPREALKACESKAENNSCSFKDPHGGAQIDGTCRHAPKGETACVPADAPMMPPKA